MAVEIATVAAVSSAFNIYQGIKQSKEQEAALLAQAAARNSAASELMDRFAFNVQALKASGEEFKDQQVAALVSSGLTGARTNVLSAMEDTNARLEKQIEIEHMEAVAKANQLRAGSALDTQLAGDVRRAGKIGAIGTFLGGAGAVALALK